MRCRLRLTAGAEDGSFLTFGFSHSVIGTPKCTVAPTFFGVLLNVANGSAFHLHFSCHHDSQPTRSVLAQSRCFYVSAIVCCQTCIFALCHFISKALVTKTCWAKELAKLSSLAPKVYCGCNPVTHSAFPRVVTRKSLDFRDCCIVPVTIEQQHAARFPEVVTGRGRSHF
jgi:hypothetical protein